MATKKFSTIILPLFVIFTLVLLLPITSGKRKPCQDWRYGCSSRVACNAKCLSLGYKGGDCVTFAFPVCCCKINLEFQDDSPTSSPIMTD
ncbi:PREDICTED: defensin-like protein 82 [Camelina sativa]|uniref:Defensin-like protein 82 n=1 Tax=Camelina sativa TaxID=90675 RepID=A0ABM1QMX3_CAMSA|nr:PREDICTED: defensin-like protein 82 [Camelina sativa]